jgi:phosphopantetheinyl transferase
MSLTTSTVANPSRASAAAPGVHDLLRSVQRRYAPAARGEVMLAGLGEAWLGRRERAELAAWRDPRRRGAWLLGRILAKQLVADAYGGLELQQIEILSRDSLGRVNRPVVWLDGVEQPGSLTISHSHRGALAALDTSGNVVLGADLADSGTFSDGFVELWFTPPERRWFQETQSSGIACFIWAAKEALYKACNRGESFAPRDVEVLPDGRCSYRHAPLAGCRLQSWTVDGHLAVLAAVARTAVQESNSSASTFR